MKSTAKLDSAGRLMVPKEVRKELGLTPSSELILNVEDGGLRVETRDAALRRAQAYFRQFNKPGESVVDDLLKERRKEARRENTGSKS
jgi:AbrB family looped-hinge helix DNA binding protein